MKEYNTQDYKDFLKDNRVSKVDRDWLVNLHMHEKPNPFKDFMKKFIGNKTVKRPVMFKRKSRALRTKTLVSRETMRPSRAR